MHENITKLRAELDKTVKSYFLLYSLIWKNLLVVKGIIEQ